jgi:hypothetical protein
MSVGGVESFASRQQLLTSIKDLLSSGEYSDIIITCGKHTYKVHRNIICPRAHFFAGAARFPGIESENKKIDLPDEEPAIVKLMLQFLYEGDYAPFIHSVLFDGPSILKAPEAHDCSPFYAFFEGSPCHKVLCSHHTCGVDCDTESVRSCRRFLCTTCHPPLPPAPPGTHPVDLLTHAKMYAIADRLLVTGLKALAHAKFKTACLHFWNAPEFTTAAEHIFVSTPDEDKGLRDLVCRTIAKHIELLNNEVIEGLLKEYNEFTYDLLRVRSEELERT